MEKLYIYTTFRFLHVHVGTHLQCSNAHPQHVYEISRHNKTTVSCICML